MVTIWLSWPIWSQSNLFLDKIIHPRASMCSGYVYLRHRPLWHCVSRDCKNIGHGDHMAIMAHMVSFFFFPNYEGIFPNSYVFGIYISPSHAMMALCIERLWNMGLGDHMAIRAHMVPLVFVLKYKNTFPNSYVFGICISPSQAMMALCIERFEKMGHGDHMAIITHMVQSVFFLILWSCFSIKYISATVL